MININEHQVRELVPMSDAIEAMRWAFTQLSNGNVLLPNRSSMDIPDKNATTLVMPAYAMGSPYFTVKIVSVNYSNPQKDLPMINAVVHVFNAEKGEQVATLDGDTVTAIRTGAASGLATDLLAREDVKTGAIFGTGVQARTQIEALTNIRQLDKILVFSREKRSARSFCDFIMNNFSLEAEASVHEDLSKADVICTATPATMPLFDHTHLNHGVHINAIGSFKPNMQELPIKTINNAKVVVDHRSACEQEAGDLIIPVQNGQWSFDQIHGEIGEVVSGKVMGRETNNEITVFKSVGIGIQDLALANMIMDRV